MSGMINEYYCARCGNQISEDENAECKGYCAGCSNDVKNRMWY